MARRIHLDRPEIRGELNHQAKLTAAQVGEIKEKYKAGQACEQIASDYHIGARHVYKILRGEKWPSLPDDEHRRITPNVKTTVATGYWRSAVIALAPLMKQNGFEPDGDISFSGVTRQYYQWWKRTAAASPKEAEDHTQ